MIHAALLILFLLVGCGGDDDQNAVIFTPTTAAIASASPTPTMLGASTPHATPEPIAVEEGEATIVVRSAAATIRIEKATVALTLEEAAGTVLTESVTPPTLRLGNDTVPLTRVTGVRRIDPGPQTLGGVELSCDAGNGTALWRIEFLTPRSLATRLRPAMPSAVTRVVTTLHAAADEHFYGLTERIVNNRSMSEIAPQAVGSLDRRGELVNMTVTPTMSLYTPFFHSSRGYGVYVEGTMTGRYDLAKADPNAVGIDFELNPRTGEHGVVYFVGAYDTLLDEYTALTGRPFLPPRWSFRHLRWRDEHRIAAPAELDGVPMNADFVNDITMYEALNIPPGNYEFDPPWTDGTTDFDQPGFTSFRFDPQRFPNSEPMMRALKNRGYHVLVFGAPWALGENAIDAEQLGYYAPRSNVLIDFTNPAAVRWWSGRLQTLIDLGVDGMKLDRSELDRTELPVVPDMVTDVFADGRSGRELKNGYTIEYARVHHDAFAARAGADFFHYLRAGYAGSQQYGVFWGGDTTARASLGIGDPTDLGLRSAILSLARVAFMGFPIWGTDTGGYYQFGDREVFARWIELSAMCPLMEIGGGNQGGGQHAPWDMPTEPHNDSEMIDIYRRYVTLHHELVPLFDSLAREAHASGRPVARPLVFEFPDDPAVADLWDQLLLGHDLLFAPLWQVGRRSRDVYLPQGEWIDYWEPKRRWMGPTTVTVNAPLDRLPIFVRAGGILPLEVSTDATGNGSAASAGRLTLDTYPQTSGTSTFVLREAGSETTLTLGVDPDSGTTMLTITPSHRAYVARLLTRRPARVLLDGGPIAESPSYEEWQQSDSWFYDPNAGRLWIRFVTHGQTTVLHVESL